MRWLAVGAFAGVVLAVVAAVVASIENDHADEASTYE